MERKMDTAKFSEARVRKYHSYWNRKYWFSDYWQITIGESPVFWGTDI